jgi:hypothetical protein
VTLIVAATTGDWVLTLGWLIALFVAVELQAATTAIERTTAAG